MPVVHGSLVDSIAHLRDAVGRGSQHRCGGWPVASDFAEQASIYRWASVRVHETVPLIPISCGIGGMITQGRQVLGLAPSLVVR